MTNPTYTDEQVLDLSEVCREGPMQAAMRHMDIAKALESLRADRQRLQAEVEALRADRDRLDYIALNGVAVRKAGNGRSNLFVWYQDYPIAGDGLLFNLRTAIDSATPNETKEAKS